MPALNAIPYENREIKEFPLKAAESFLDGALVLMTSNEVLECSADPAAVLGISVEGPVNLLEVTKTKARVAMATPQATFHMSGTRDPAVTDIGVQYGVVKDADGIWTVDFADVVNLVVVVENVDLDRNLSTVRFLAAVQQGAP